MSRYQLYLFNSLISDYLLLLMINDLKDPHHHPDNGQIQLSAVFC